MSGSKLALLRQSSTLDSDTRDHLEDHDNYIYVHNITLVSYLSVPLPEATQVTFGQQYDILGPL